MLAQTPGVPASQPPPPPVTQPGTVQPSDVQKTLEEIKKEKAEQQLKQQEHQRILGIIPEFNTSNIPDAVALSPKQKFELALRGAVDPFQFAIAGLDAGLDQLENQYPGYGEGVEGYAKRYGASYADAFDGEILGNAVFPILLHEDPRYFRKGTGSIGSRIVYATESTIRCKSDKGRWVPNFGNVLGNLAAGGISNLYYPASDRGAGLTIQNAFVVTAEGALGALGYEFWPDVQRKYLHRRHKPPTD